MLTNQNVFLMLILSLIFGCSPIATIESFSLKEPVTECQVYRTGSGSVYYLLAIHSDKIVAEYVSFNGVKKSETAKLTNEDYQRFVSLFGKALSQKKLPYTFWKGGEEMLIKNGDMKLLLALGDVKDGVYPKDVSNLVDFIYAISPMPLELAGF